MFSFKWLNIIWREGVRLKLRVQGQGGERTLDVDGQGGGGLKNWTVFMDVICVSSPIFFRIISKWYAHFTHPLHTIIKSNICYTQNHIAKSKICFSILKKKTFACGRVKALLRLAYSLRSEFQTIIRTLWSCAAVTITLSQRHRL